MRWKRATRSVCVNDRTWPTCSEPLTVGGGVSIENTSERGRVRSKRYTPDPSHSGAHFASSPSRAGFSGRRRRAGSRLVSDDDDFGMRGSYTEIGELANWRIGESIHQLTNSPTHQLTNSPII